MTLASVPAAGLEPASARRAPAQPQLPPPSVVLNGIMVSNDNWTSDADAGVYSLEARPGGAVTCQHRSPAMMNTAAAVRKDNVLYAVEASQQGYFYVQYSTNTWSSNSSRQEIDLVNLPSDLTYDPVTAKVYGGFYDENNQSFSRFASFGLTTAEATDINSADRDERDIFAIAADGKGKIYGLFGAFDYLVTFNPRTGAVDRIGKTGLEPVSNNALGHVSSMCYDEANDRLLAAVYQESGYGANKKCWSGLYEIDPATGTSTLLYNFDGNACFAGLYVADDSAPATAPAAPVALKVTFDAGALTGTLEFSAPDKSVGGAPLSGSLMALVSVNGVETVVADIVPGSKVTVPGLVFADGDNTVKVTMADENARGESAELSVWAGEDIPAPVSDVTLTVDGGKASLTWKAPASGVNGGAIIADALRYTVTRYPGAKVVADAFEGTAFTDNSIDPTWKVLYYTVKAYNGKGAAEAVASNKCPAAGALQLPFDETFDTADDFDVWTVVNVNGGSTWEYDKSDKAARYKYHEENLAGDDWLITPPMAMKAGQTYKIKYGYRAFNERYSESFEVMLGASPSPAAMTTRLAAHESFNNTKEQAAETSFTVPADGNYFIGFHNYSAPKMWSMYLDNIRIEPIDSRVPAVVSDLKVVPAAAGTLKADITFTAPATDTEGRALTSLRSATVRRSGLDTPVAVLEGIEPGQSLRAEDTDLPASGLYTYSVVVENEVGASVTATVDAYVGVDAPGQVGNLTLVEADRHPVLSWEAPATGANGGWFDASSLTYRIVRSDGVVVAEACTETSFTDMSYTSPSASQDAIWYLVTPYSGDVKGTYAQTELTLFGTPYSTPATETFSGADMLYYPWIAQSDNAVRYAWTLDTSGYTPVAADQSGDRGLATFHSVGEPVGTVSWFYSPKFDISGLSTPALTFWMYHSPSVEGDGSMEVFVDSGTGFVSPALTIARAEGDADGWVRHVVALAASDGVVRVAFRGTGDAAADIYIDNVAIADIAETDAALNSVDGPARIAAGVKADYRVGVLNAGSSDLADVKVTLTVDGVEKASSVISSVAAGKIEALTVAYTPEAVGQHALLFTVEALGDKVADNNTAAVALTAVEPVVPRPANLSAVRADDGSAVLSWEEPSKRASVVDDVESYPAWAIDGIGEWSMFDGDYDLTYYINKDAGEYPNATARKAFQVLDVALLGIDIWDEGKAHSGKRLFAALAGINYVNNDWLISPRLNGAEQWISFYARSFTTDGVAPERMRVLASSDDTDPVNFEPLTDTYVELDGTWREYRYFLPAGTRHFAINCVSDGSFALFVDDIRFNDLSVPAWRVTGYEVYRDGVRLGETSLPFYVDSECEGKAVYTVRAIYGEHGAGPDSDPVTLEASGIVDPTAGAVPVEAFTVDGRRIDIRDAVAGIYIVRYSDGTVKKIAAE
ncbi:MAG: choice-of-anchor J domain-containing protein [Muribaculaceae bacterium]|nr:choice-of-anchor J domain-containing protein [Muribaculaceae bacterium]